MAQIRCANHLPEESYHRNFVKTLPYEEHTCEKAGCNEKAVIWLNPEEVSVFELGTRSFHDVDYNSYKTQDSETSVYEVKYFQLLWKKIKQQFSIENVSTDTPAPSVQLSSQNSSSLQEVNSL